MRGDSIFSTTHHYIYEIFSGIRSILRACTTAFPYLFPIRSEEFRKEVTEQYPDPVSSRTADDLPPRTRGLLYNDIERCTGCKDCERICPVKCIHVKTDAVPEGSKPWVSVFEVDFARCIFCGFCVEVCNPASLIHSKQFEMAMPSRRGLVAQFGRGHLTQEQLQKLSLNPKKHTEGNRSW